MLDDLYKNNPYTIVPPSPMEKLRKSLRALQGESGEEDDPGLNPSACSSKAEGDDGDDGSSSADLGNSPKPSLRKRRKKTNGPSIDLNM